MDTAPVSTVATKVPAFADKSTGGGGNFTEHLEAHARERQAPAGTNDDRPAAERDHGDAARQTDPARADSDAARAAHGADDDATPAETEPSDETAGDDVPAAETATAPAEDGMDPGDDPAVAKAGSGVPDPASSVGSTPAAAVVTAVAGPAPGADAAISAAAPAFAGENSPPAVSSAVPATPATPAVPGPGGEAATPGVPATPATPAPHAQAHLQGDALKTAPATAAAQGTAAAPATPAIPPVSHSVAAGKSAAPGQTSAMVPAVPATRAIPATLEGPATPATPASTALAAQSAQAADGSATVFDHGSSSGNDNRGSSGEKPQTAAEAFSKGVLRAGGTPVITAPPTSQAEIHMAPTAIDVARAPAPDSGQTLMALQGAADGTAPAPASQGSQPPAAAVGSEIRFVGNTAAAAQASYNGRAEVLPAAQQVAVQITRTVQSGADRFTIELKPVALGRVTVNLEIGYDNRVIAVLSAERADTLDLLQRDSRALERALQDAGLSTDSGSLSFSLEGENGDDEPFGPDGAGFLAHDADGDGSATVAGYAQYIGNDAIDIRV